MPSPTQDEEIERIAAIVNPFIEKWLPEHYAHLVDTDDNDGQYLRAALHRLLLKERLDELKSALHKGYFIPEMEVQAEDRITKLNSQIEGSKSDDKP